MVAVSDVPGEGPFGLVTTCFRVTVTPRCLPLFTVVLVHDWYMNVLQDPPRSVTSSEMVGLPKRPSELIVPPARERGHAGSWATFVDAPECHSPA